MASIPPPTASPYILVAFGAYMAGVFVLGALAHHLLERGSFLKQYFLGDRKLNAWVLSLTYVATSVSAGSFVGFPSLIYLNGWIMALWIAGYMVTGLVSKGVLAKRLNQVSRLSGAITVLVYTTHGGFWAVTWTDVLQGLMIVAGALLLMFLALARVGSLGEATQKLQALDPRLVTGPGPDDYLGPGLAISYFCLWTLG